MYNPDIREGVLVDFGLAEVSLYRTHGIFHTLTSQISERERNIAGRVSAHALLRCAVADYSIVTTTHIATPVHYHRATRKMILDRQDGRTVQELVDSERQKFCSNVQTRLPRLICGLLVSFY